MNKEECEKASEIISEYIITASEFTPVTDKMCEAMELLDELIAEHFELVEHTTPKEVLWIFDDEPVCPS